MSDHSETFRTELAMRLLETLPQDQVSAVLSALDETMNGYTVSHKETSLIVADGIPDVVKWFIASKSVENLSFGTLKLYKYRLFDFFSIIRKPFTDIRPGDIRGYLNFYKSQRNASNHYLDEIRRVLNSFFTWLVKNEYLLRNPCANVEKVKHQEPPREPLSAYELEVVRWNCKTIREKAMVDFLFSTGARVSECMNVDLSDIDWATRSVVIRHGKGDKRRIVYFNAESELTLRKYLESRRDDNEALFVSCRNPHGRLGVRAMEAEIRRIAKRCSIHTYPHKLRHTFATSNLLGGMPLDKLQSLMGHAKPETTLIYAKQDQTALRMEYARVHAC